MTDNQTTETHDRLRLSPEDVLLLWGILDGARLKCTERWPRLERIIFDLEVMANTKEMSA